MDKETHPTYKNALARFNEQAESASKLGASSNISLHQERDAHGKPTLSVLSESTVNNQGHRVEFRSELDHVSGDIRNYRIESMSSWDAEKGVRVTHTAVQSNAIEPNGTTYSDAYSSTEEKKQIASLDKGQTSLVSTTTQYADGAKVHTQAVVESMKDEHGVEFRQSTGITRSESANGDISTTAQVSRSELIQKGNRYSSNNVSQQISVSEAQSKMSESISRHSAADSFSHQSSFEEGHHSIRSIGASHGFAKSSPRSVSTELATASNANQDRQSVASSQTSFGGNRALADSSSTGSSAKSVGRSLGD